jgi:hypothetical protein
MWAAGVVKRQSTLAPKRLRSVSHAFASRLSASSSGSLRFGEAVPHQSGDLYLGHVQPRAMHRGIAELDPPRQQTRLLGIESFVKGCRGVGGEIVQHYPDLTRLRVILLSDASHLLGELALAASLGYLHASPSRQGLEGHVRVGRAALPILVVHKPRAAPGPPGRAGGAVRARLRAVGRAARRSRPPAVARRRAPRRGPKPFPCATRTPRFLGAGSPTP